MCGYCREDLNEPGSNEYEYEYKYEYEYEYYSKNIFKQIQIRILFVKGTIRIIRKIQTILKVQIILKIRIIR